MPFDRNKPVKADEMLKRDKASAAMVEYWDLTDALIDGANAVRQAGEKYLPKFVDEGKEDYDYRLKTTKFTNVYRDIVEALASKPFEQNVTLVGENQPSQIQDFIVDVDGSGTDLTGFLSSVFYNGINSAIDWIFVDYPKQTETAGIRSVADLKASGIRPFWSRVLGRNILSAQSKIINGQETLTYVKILEPGQPDHVRIIERLETGSVVWELWQKNEKDEFLFEDDGTISINVIPLVPFYTGRRDGRTFRFFPAMRDAADLQVELYQDESALKFVKRLAGYPMLAGNGVSPVMEADGKTPKKLRTGPGVVLYAPRNGNGDHGVWTYVEPSAQTLKFLGEDIKDTIQQLRELGRQPLTAQSGNLTVITTAVAAGKAKSAVAAWALSLGNAGETALKYTALWLSLNEKDFTLDVYSDFDNFIEGKDYEQLRAMREAGDISQETYWHELKRRGLLNSDFNADEEIENLLKELPGDGEDNNPDNINDDPQVGAV